MRKSIITILGVILITLLLGIALADPWETYKNTAYSRSDVVIGPTFDFTTSAAGTTTLTNGATIPSGEVLAGDVTGTASRIAVGSFIDTAYGLKNSTANKAQVNISANMGLRLGTGATAGSIEVYPGDGIDVGASGTAVDVTDIVDQAYGIDETTTNNIGINLTADKGLEFGTGVVEGSLQVEAGNGIKLSSSGIAVEPTDIIDVSYGLMDSSDDIRINLTPNAGLEFSAVGATLGSLGINLDGYSLSLGASGLKVNSTDTIEVAGIVASSTSYLNDTTVGSGDALTVTTADKLTVATVIVPVYETFSFPITNQSVDEYAFVSDDAWWLVKAEEIHSVAGTAVAPTAANLTIRICDDNEAPNAGINATTAVIPLNDAVNNINTASLNSSNSLIADGDMIAFDYSGTMTAVRGVVTLTLRRM
jgi:hypothetical protein